MSVDQYLREKLLIGDTGLARLKNASVVVCGLGGVGSYLAETMVRSGVGKLILVDFDSISESNINRQLFALHSSIGLEKVDVVEQRFSDIDPQCRIVKKNAYLDLENASLILDEPVDYIADAIDFLPGKVGLIRFARERNIPLISAMGAGKRLDPEKLHICDISETHICPLAKRLRRELKNYGIESGVDVVFSTENPISQLDNTAIGSMAFVPAVMGILMASHIVRKLIS